MHYPILSFLLILLSTSAFSQAEQAIASQIDKVTVYRHGAQVQRSAAIQTGEGRHTLIFTGITTSLVEKSIQVSVQNPDLLILSVLQQVHFPDAPLETADDGRVNTQLKSLGTRQRRLETQISIGKEEEAILQVNRELGGTEAGLDAVELERGVRYHRERLTAIRMERLQLRDSLRSLETFRDSLVRQLSQLSGDTITEATSQIVVEIDAQRPLQDSMKLSYLVADAAWDPAYDVRLIDVGQPLDLRFNARVHQESGEDWEDVHLILSTGNPARSASSPDLLTWRLAPYLRPPTYDRSDPGLDLTTVREVSGQVTDQDGNPLIGVSVTVPGSSIGTVTDLSGHYRLQLPEKSRELIFSSTGYENRTIGITGPRMDALLSEQAVVLDEVVVTGYGGMDGKVAGLLTQATRNKGNDGTPSVPMTVERRPTTLNFAIDLPYTIPSGTPARILPIQRFNLPAVYRHTAVPKVEERVFLSAIVRDWEQYDLMSGEMELFVGGIYLGSGQLEVSQTADSLVFSLGADPGVVVERSAAQRFDRNSGLFGGSERFGGIGKSSPVTLNRFLSIS